MQRGIEGSIVMLNLLRFRDVAVYTANHELTPEKHRVSPELYRPGLALFQFLPGANVFSFECHS